MDAPVLVWIPCDYNWNSLLASTIENTKTSGIQTPYIISDNNLTLYVFILQVLDDMLEGQSVAVSTIVADFEQAIWKAVKLALPGINVRGCNFHWKQAIWRKVKTV